MKFILTLSLLALLTAFQRHFAEAVSGKDFPYVVAITYNKNCCDKGLKRTKSGTLINAKYVLCRSYTSGDLFQKTLRVFLTKNGKVTSKSFEVEKVILHPKNQMNKDVVNMALLKLKGCVNDIKPVTLEVQRERKIKRGTTVVAIKLISDSRGATIVKPYNINVSSKRECKSHYQGPHMFCSKNDAEYSMYGIGPTMFYNQDEGIWKQIGLSSFRLNPKTFYTRINDVMGWINQNIDADEVAQCKEPETTTTEEPEISSEETTIKTTTPEPDESDETPVELK